MRNPWISKDSRARQAFLMKRQNAERACRAATNCEKLLWVMPYSEHKKRGNFSRLMVKEEPFDVANEACF
jgi:hypothetical protein